MGKLTISMAIFNSYVSHYQRVVRSFFDSLDHLFRPAPFEGIGRSGEEGAADVGVAPYSELAGWLIEWNNLNLNG